MVSFKWQQLVENLEIVEDETGSQLLTSEQLESIEIARNITFPIDYKEYCQLLGTGLLADGIRIFCPVEGYILSESETLRQTIARIRKFAKEYSLPVDPSRDQRVVNLLENAFPFGDMYSSTKLIVWDLRTYSASDGSYDIYYVDCDFPELEDPLLIGRDFFEFIQNFCYGERANELLPNIFDVPFSEMDYTFFQFTPPWN